MKPWPEIIGLNKTGVSRAIEKSRSIVTASSSRPADVEDSLFFLSNYPFLETNMNIEGLWRGRKHPAGTHWDHMGALWYPPPTKVRARGRLNGIGESLFYASPHRHLAGLELYAEVGDWVSVMAIESRNQPYAELTVMSVGIDRCGKDAKGSMRWISPRENSFLKEHLKTGENFQSWCLVDDFLSDLMTTKVPPGTENIYVATNRIADILFKIVGKLGDVDGCLYPGVGAGLHGYNLCLTPLAADKHFKPAACHVFQLGESPEPWALFQASLVASSRRIDESGEIEWMRFPENERDEAEFYSAICGPPWAQLTPPTF